MITIRSMTSADVPLGMTLSQQAEWNQTRADWCRFLSLESSGCFVGELDGQPVGTVTTCVLGDVAWIGMLLVSIAVRRRGIGTLLIKHALTHLAQRQVASVRLDATPLGQPIYEKLGFRPQYALSRFAGRPQAQSVRSGVERLRAADEPAVATLDACVIGYDRRRLLHELRREAIESLIVRDPHGLSGYLLMRVGRIATQIGPAIATSPSGGRELLGRALHELAGSDVLVDIPQSNLPATEFALRAGLRPVRELMRMCRGHQVIEQTECLWASSGPEKG